MTYTPRTTQPDNGDLRYTRADYGGYCTTNFSGSPQPWTGSVLANCVGYVHGRWMEIGNTNTDYNLSHGNAKEYYNYADGYERGQDPKLGAILCLGGGANGHVCVVEEIAEDGSWIKTSESNYGGPVFRYWTRYKAYGWRPGDSSAYVGGFQGFIYHPDVSPEPVIPEYNIYIYNGTASKTTAKEGETITITATVEKGKHFQRWATSGVTLDHPASKTTTFVMPANDVYLTAIVKENTTTVFKKGYQAYRGGFI